MTYRKFLKPIFDFVLALVAFLLALPVMLLIIAGLFLTGHRKIFFLQQRLGINEKLFYVYKFRTMTDKQNAQGVLLPDEDRLTSFGAFLRKASLDELPQLLNVLKGDMSLVGPRPLLANYLPLYSKEQRERHNVRPGITGWTQVNGRNALSWKRKFELDCWYVKNISFSTDCKIILLTIQRVLRRTGINQDGQATVEPFNGRN